MNFFNTWVKLFLRHSFIIIKCNWEESFPKMGLWLWTFNKGKQVTYSNSSFKLWIERKYAIELIPVKIYKKYLVFLVKKTPKVIKIASLWLVKVKAHALLYFILLSLLKPSKLVKNLLLHKRIKKNLIIFQTNRLSNSSSI